jgi:site-specific DNA-methyltransferase (adenine-specific)
MPDIHNEPQPTSDPAVRCSVLLGELELHNTDCMEIMAKYQDKHFDLAIVDPPYGIGKALVSGGATSGGWHRMVASNADKWDVPPPPEYFNELWRVSKNQIIWGGNFFPLPPTRKPICWDKVRPNQKNASEWEYAWTSFDGRARRFSWCANGGFLLEEPRIHPTQKPVALYSWLLAEFAAPTDRILDTHMGSGNIAIACYNHGLPLVACEIDPGYYEAAIERIRRETRQTLLFS